jgi:hypothetical protein
LEESSVHQVGKLDAANRQLDFAIDLFFSEGDPVCVHTLAGAASILLSDLIQDRAPDRSWDRMAQVDNNLSPSEYFKTIRRVQNFLKHAEHGANAVLSFNEVETEDLMMLAVLNSAELQELSMHQSVFRLWYLASRANTLGLDYPFVKDALRFFPGIALSPPADQRTVGLRVLRSELGAPAGNS